MDIVPEPDRDDMPQRVTLVMEHHLGLPGCTGSKEDDERVGAPGLFRPRYVYDLCRNRRRVVHLYRVTDPAVALAIDQHLAGERWAFLCDCIDLVGVLQARDHHLDIGEVDTVFQVFWGEHGGGRAVYCTTLDQGKGKRPPFRYPREHDQGPLSLIEPVLDQHVHDLVGHQL